MLKVLIIIICILINCNAYTETLDVNAHLKIHDKYRSINNSGQYYSQVEIDSPDNKYFKREKDKLHIILSNNKNIVFENTGSDPDIDVYHYYSFIKPINSHLVNVGHYEGGSYLLINNNTGIISMIDDLPVIGPNIKYFFTATIESYSPKRIQIWSIEKDIFQIIFTYDLPDINAYISKRNWVNDYSFEVIYNQRSYDIKTKKSSLITKILKITLNNNIWNIFIQ